MMYTPLRIAFFIAIVIEIVGSSSLALFLSLFLAVWKCVVIRGRP